ncbi:MAG: UbiA family prenyltransferase [Proteobacteria bacterium]|nr:UbiA family prenyltransferase [Pseudomonadota bacterium]
MLHTLRGLIQVTHPDAWLQGALYMLLGTYLGGGVTSLQSPVVVRAMLIVGLIVAASFAFNDYRDTVVDSVNKPKRAIPSGQIPRSAALVLAFGLTLVALSLIWTLSPVPLIIAIVNIILSACYSLFLKNTLLLGHVTIAYLNSTIIVYGCLIVAAPTFVVWLVSLTSFFFTLAQEMLLVVEDQVGDRLAGLRTTAVRLGARTTLHLFRIFALASIVIMFLPWLLGLSSTLYLYALLPCTILPTIIAVGLVTRKFVDNNLHLSSKLILWSRALSLLPVLLLGFSK